MKKIAVLTFHWTINYGGILQACALQETICGLGDYSVEFINFYNQKEIVSALKPFRRVLHKIWDFTARTVFDRKKRERRTEEFRGKNLNISHVPCQSLDALKALPPYDAYIVGSDQVWNPDLTSNPAAYLLSFTDSRCKIAYAASFGKSSIKKELYPLYADELRKFKAISVREEDALVLLEQIGIRGASAVLDPVLLLSRESWLAKASERVVNDEYILCYYMPTSDKTVTSSIRKIARVLSRKTNAKIVNIGKKEFEKLKFYEHNLLDVGPAEFISLIANARYVITNSFHGTAFSIKMNIPFYVPVNFSVPPEKRLANRIECLLRKFECVSRVLDSNSSQFELQDTDMDFTKINQILTESVNDSTAFLKEALNG